MPIMSDLLKQVNIGKELEKILLLAGIDSFDKLKKNGSKKTFKTLKSIYEGACLNKLYALEGAIQGIRWHNLDDKKKQKLKEFFNSIK
jgi:DNA transformation protein and related proteins